MAVVIRLKTIGTKKKIKHRIVVTDSHFPRDGRFLEEIGFWDPSKEPPVVSVNADRAKEWIEKGAVPSDTVRSILKKAKINPAATKTGTKAKKA